MLLSIKMACLHVLMILDWRQTQHNGQSWYARLTDEKKAEYKQRQSIARQKKKAATQSIVNLEQGSQTPEASLRISRRTPLSNMTNTLPSGKTL
jgi:hypothetical protein